MTIRRGTIQNSYVSSDHVGWQTVGFFVTLDLRNQTLIGAYFNGDPLIPICRVSVEKVSTGVETQIPGLVISLRVSTNKDSNRGTFSFHLKPKKLGTDFSNLFGTELDTSYDYFVKIKAGYIIGGNEILVPLMKGHTLDRFPAFGPNSSAMTIHGADFSEKLEKTTGIISGITTAVGVLTRVNNNAGLNLINTMNYTDFTLPTGFSFNNNNGLEIINRIADFNGAVWYFDGSGIFTIRDKDNLENPTEDYSLPTSRVNVFKPDKTIRRVLTRVNIVGDGVSKTRQTDSADRAKFGENRPKTIQNSLITTEAQAISVADIEINDSRKDKGSMVVDFFPYFYIQTIVKTSHQEVGTDIKYRVNGFTHFFNGETKIFKTSLSSERTDFDNPNIEDG